MRKTILRKDYQKFIQKLIQARKNAGLRQADVSKKLKRHQSYLSRLESGEYRVDVMEVKDLSRIYNVDVDVLLE